MTGVQHGMCEFHAAWHGRGMAWHGQGIIFELAFIWNDNSQEAASLPFKKCPVPIYFQKYCH